MARHHYFYETPLAPSFNFDGAESNRQIYKTSRFFGDREDFAKSVCESLLSREPTVYLIAGMDKKIEHMYTGKSSEFEIE